MHRLLNLEVPSRIVGTGVLALAVALSPASMAEEAPPPPTDDATAQTAEQAPDAAAQKAALKAKAKANEAEQMEHFRSVVHPSAAEALESDTIKMHSAREQYLLTYPTGIMPTQPWDKARAHNREHVGNAPPWAGPPVEIRGNAVGHKAGYDWAQKATVSPNENVWTPLGPRPLDSVGTTNNAYTYGTVGGRVGAEALASDPSNPSVAYAGFVAGGLWKTTNLGSPDVDWTPLWDSDDTLTQAVSAITIDPTNPSIVYVGTGDWAASDQFGVGIMKSTDAGATWAHLGAEVFTPYSQTLPVGGNRWSNQNIKTIQVDPNDPSTLLVGTRYDLYLSNDGGQSWQICGFGANYTDPTAGVGSAVTVNRVSGIVLDSRGAQTVAYVAIGYIAYNGNGNNGVYRFTVPASGCPSAGSIELLNGGFPAGTGNGLNADSGGSATGRIEIDDAIGPDGNLTLVAQVSDANTLANLGTYVLRPDGGSTTWTLLSGSAGDGAFPDCNGGTGLTGQDWYDMFLAVDPTDDKTLYVGHIDAYKGTINSSYTGVSFDNLTNVYASSCPEYGTVHPDQHAFTFVEGSGGTAMLVGNDGGVYYNGASGDSLSWQQVNDDFNTHQFYGGQIGADFAGNGMNGVQWAFGGMQDNGNASWDSGTSDATWTARGVGGDGFYTAFDPIAGSLTNGLWVTEYVYGDMYCSTSGADGPYGSSRGPFLSTCSPNWSGSPDWSTPFVIDAFNCNSSGCTNHLAGGDYAYASTSSGSLSWSRVSGNLTNGGSILTVNTSISSPTHAVTGSSDGKVFWSPDYLSGTSCTAAAANTSSLSCSPNTGATWVDVDPSGNVLPNRAMGQVAFDPSDENVLYAAVLGFDVNTPTTPGHIFQATCSGSSCTVVDKSGNLPDVPASSVVVNPHNPSQVFLGTYFGFYYTDDIGAASPTWVKYNEGLPTTIIKHLTIDRGPASSPKLATTLAAFTYGRGVYVLRLPTGSTGGNNPPVADFGDSCTDLACTFTDLSTDSDGTIASRSWSFGDGATSTATNPSHTYGAAGTYTVTLTVIDDGGLSDSASQSVTVTAPSSSITLSANGYKVRGVHTIDLSWSGATGTNVDVYRNGSLQITTANDGAYTDSTGNKGGGTYDYQVCEAGTSSCSNTVTVVF